MAFSFINQVASGTYQSILQRLIDDPETINLTESTPSVNSSQSIPFDGQQESIRLDTTIVTNNIGASGASASNVAFEAWILPNVTGQSHNTFFDTSMIRSISATTTSFDGFYSGHVLTTGGFNYIDFRIDHDISYSLTSDASIASDTWTHVYCEYASGSQTMSLYINGTLDRSHTTQLPTASSITSVALGQRGITFGGRIDELRLWIATGSASSIGRLASATSIGIPPEDISVLNDFTPSANTMAGWWRLESVSAFQLFSGVEDSIIDSTQYEHHGTPSGFQGSDSIATTNVIIQGLSASGDLNHLLGGTLDHGGLSVIDNGDNTIKLDMGVESLQKEEFYQWASTGTGVLANVDSNNIFFGASATRVNTTSADTGVYQDITASGLLYKDNQYTCSIRLRSITGSLSARVIFKLGESASSITAVMNTKTWEPFYITHRLVGDTLTGRVTVTQLNEADNAGALWQMDGFDVVEGDYPAPFIGPTRVRKSGQIYWQILE